MKCEHGQPITKFCISETCNFKTSAACIYCLKKNHLHPGHFQSLSPKQVEDLINCLTIKKDKKLKQASLKQLLLNYFQAFKNQLNKSFEIVCKSMIDRVSNAYLFSENLLQTYKKARTKEFNKISSVELRQLHLFSMNNTTLNLQKQEERLYKEELLRIQHAIESIKGIFQAYQSEINEYDRHFAPDNFFYKRIIELSGKVLSQKSDSQIRESRSPITITITQSVKINPESQQLTKTRPYQQFSEPPILLSLEEYKNQKIKSTQSIKSKQHLKSNENLNIQILNVPNPKKQRKLSIALDSQNHNIQQVNNYDEKVPIIKIHGSNHSKERQQTSKGHIKKNGKAISDQLTSKVGSSNPQQLKLLKSPSFINAQNLHFKECNSFEITELQKSQQKVILQNKKIKYAAGSDNDHDYIKCFDHREQIRKKIVKLDFEACNLQHSQEIQSPMLRKNIQSKQKYNPEVMRLQNIMGKQQKNLSKKNQHQEQVYLSQQQLKSLALLLESVKHPSDKALRYLKKSFQYCPQNLSTAEYLSFILLEQNHPKQCLQLCNLMISKIFTHTQNYNFSVHILNNKAAALNLLGRFSETIQFLQKIVESIQKDSLYKNLGDAYCALGISQKSMLNYQKCITLNPDYDQAYYNLAVCLYSQHHFEQAFVIITQALKLNPHKEEYIELYKNTKPKVST